MGDSMVIKTDEIKAEMVNYIKTKYDNNIISNSNSKPSPQSNNYTIIREKMLAAHAGTASNFFLG